MRRFKRINKHKGRHSKWNILKALEIFCYVLPLCGFRMFDVIALENG